MSAVRSVHGRAVMLSAVRRINLYLDTRRFLLTCCNRCAYPRGMGRHIPRTAADEVKDAQRAIDDAFAELTNLHGHLAALATDPASQQAVSRQAQRSARIVDSLLEQASDRLREATRLERAQLTSVS